jgi:SNF2 family DNA or RNA helicase
MAHSHTSTNNLRDAESWKERLFQAFEQKDARPLKLAELALKDYPHDPLILNLAALAALLEENPERCMRYEKRLSKRYIPNEGDHLLRALALAQQNHWVAAEEILKRHNLTNPYGAMQRLPGAWSLRPWLTNWLNRIQRECHNLRSRRKQPATRTRKKVEPAKAKQTQTTPDKTIIEPPETESTVPELSQLKPQINIRFELTNSNAIRIEGGGQGKPLEEPIWFRLRTEFAHLSLLQGFDELLCLPQLHHVETYWYQVETVRKVLKQFRGRVLLADEVGLGKTVEAGMVLKEYLLRGMVERFLILTPASLVGQWHEEMESKFDIACITSYDPMVRNNPEQFWAQPGIIASIATARRKDNFARLTLQRYDLVIVDEAHHLKNRSTQNYKLVDALKKRFLLLLSATPVQNSLVELYNLLTLLKPGIFQTEKEFRSAYMTPGKPRIPAHRERMQDLMRDVMIRNTRALVDVRLPPRRAVTLRVEADAKENDCYQELAALVRMVHAAGPQHHRLALHHLLSAAGSSPAAAVAAIHRYIAHHKDDEHWHKLHDRYHELTAGAKEAALLELLQRNPVEKKMVFVHHRETLEHLDQLLTDQGIPFARYEGVLSGPHKDAAIDAFRDQVPVLLCTESGGEGRNVQFCNTLVNFDLPWNPMAIEQRIGRIHRIGQRREVFIFNLALRNTLEDQVLHILDEKINMFELVVGEVGAILGELEEQQDFSELVFNAWVDSTEQGRTAALTELGERIVKAKHQYEAIKELDDELFGEEFETA